MSVSLVSSGVSANLCYYGERGVPQTQAGRIWCSVLIHTLERDKRSATGYSPKQLPDYHFTVYRQGSGEVGRFTYHPKTRPNPIALRDRTVTRLVKEFLGVV